MSKVDDIIAAARAQLGKPYVFGDEGPNTFDCSGLMQYSFAQAGVKLPRTSQEQQKFATPVTNPLPGDLVFWGNPAYHVALYIGDNKVIAAPEPGDVVKVQDIWGSPTYGRVSGIGSATAPIVGAATQAAGLAGDALASVLGSARYVALEAVVVLAGLGLVGYGLWRAVAPTAKKAVTNNLEGIV